MVRLREIDKAPIMMMGRMIMMFTCCFSAMVNESGLVWPHDIDANANHKM